MSDRTAPGALRGLFLLPFPGPKAGMARLHKAAENGVGHASC